MASQQPVVDRVGQLQRIASQATSPHALGRLIDRCEEALHEELEPQQRQTVHHIAAWAHTTRSLEHQLRGASQAVLDDLNSAILHDPACAAARHQRGLIHVAAGALRPALADFSRAIEAEPKDVVALLNRASVHLELGQSDLALADCQNGLHRMRDRPQQELTAKLLELRGQALQQTGDLHGASLDFTHALQLKPTSGTLYLRRGALFAQLGHYEQARDDLLGALQADPSSAEAYRCLAWLLATCPKASVRDTPTALEAARRSRQLSANEDVRMLETLAAAHAAQGHFAKAQAFQQRALLASSPGRAQQAAEARLAIYRQNKPYLAASPQAEPRR